MQVCFVSAIPLSLAVFMAPHVRAAARSYSVTLVASDAPDMAGFDANVQYARVGISRPISPVADIRALFGLWRLFRARRFDMVVSITPKAGLLTMIAGRLAGVPVRIHWFTGQVWATRGGSGRAVLKTLDRVLARCSTHPLADSASQRDFLEREQVVRPGQVTVLAQGSVCGVDTARFKPDAQKRSVIRERLGIPATAVVALYLGRLGVDKGLRELAEAFASAAKQAPELHLLVVGPDEDGLRPSLEATLAGARPRAHFVETTTPEPEAYMAAADLFVLPSYREGFGATVIEAAACGLPAICSRVYGLTDAVATDTGILVPVRDVPALAAAMLDLARDAERRQQMACRARERVERQFAQPVLTAAFEAFCAASLAEARPRA